MYAVCDTCCKFIDVCFSVVKRPPTVQLHKLYQHVKWPCQIVETVAAEGFLYVIFVFNSHLKVMINYVAESKERMLNHKVCFGAKSFESVAFERFVQ